MVISILFLLRVLLLKKESFLRMNLKLGAPLVPLLLSSLLIKDGSSLVVTPSSIPNSTTCGPDVDLSSDEGSKEVLENSEDESVTKKRVSDSNEDDSGEHETEAMGMYLFPLLDLLFFLIEFFFYITS